MAKKSSKMGALNMTQIEAEAEDGTVVVSGNNVFASGRSASSTSPSSPANS